MIYHWLKVWISIGLRLYYRNYRVIGRENIPRKGGIIFAGNHQCALMDALNIVISSDQPVYFATRADLFAKPWVRKLLSFIKMHPVYRPRDGWRNMDKNEDSFRFFMSKLHNGEAVGIFPEGAPSYHFNLLPLKKGLARMALQTVKEQPDFPLYIVPVGLQYESPQEHLKNVEIRFGKSILVNDFLNEYETHKGKALRHFTQLIQQRISDLIIDIPLGENYDSINYFRKEKSNQFHIQKKEIKTLLQVKDVAPGKFKKTTSEIQIKLEKNIPIKHNTTLEQKIRETLFALTVSPLGIPGLILIFPLLFFCKKRVLKNTKDSQFISTSLFGHLFVIGHIYGLIISILISIVVNIPFLISLVIIFLMMICGINIKRHLS